MSFRPKLDSLNPVDTFGTEKDKESGSYLGRKVVTLPAAEKYRLKWKELGITWLNSLEETTIAAQALLPIGWDMKMGPPDISWNAIIDTNGYERAVLFTISSVKNGVIEFFNMVNFLTQEESLRRFKQEKKINKYEEKEIMQNDKIEEDDQNFIPQESDEEIGELNHNLKDLDFGSDNE